MHDNNDNFNVTFGTSHCRLDEAHPRFRGIGFGAGFGWAQGDLHLRHPDLVRTQGAKPVKWPSIDVQTLLDF